MQSLLVGAVVVVEPTRVAQVVVGQVAILLDGLGQQIQ
jgi:hypothetical protein